MEKNGCIYNEKFKLWLTPAGQCCVPLCLLPWLVDIVHQQTHAGKEGMVGLLLQSWWSPLFDQCAQKVIQRCLICQKYNIGKGTPCPIGRTPLPAGPFDTIQLDFIELPKTQCYKYCLVIIDVFSKWIEAYPTTCNTAETVVKILLREIIPRFGIPNCISSDNGPHFTARINKELCDQLNIKQQFHCPYHPQSAGLVERANQTLKLKLSKLTEETGLSWFKILPLALFQMRVTPQQQTKLSPAEILYGKTLQTPWAFSRTHSPSDIYEMTNEVCDYVIALTKSLQQYHLQVQKQHKEGGGQTEDSKDIGPKIQAGDYVLTRNWTHRKLEPRWNGPFQVLLTSPTAAKLQGREKWVHLNHCKRLAYT